MKRVLLRTVLPMAVGAVAVAVALLAVARRWGGVHEAISSIGPTDLALSLIFGMIGTYAPYRIWREMLLGLGARSQTRSSARLFFVSQLGKYLPGAVWPVIAQMEYGARAGLSRRSMLAANMLTFVLSLAVGLGLAGICLPLSSTAALHRFWWTFLLIPVLVALLHPRAIPAFIDWALRLLGRAPVGARLPFRYSVRGIAWGLVSWIALGLHLRALTSGLGAHGWPALLAAIGGEALAVSAGVIFVPAPAGAGIRDAVLVATLTPSLGATNALAAALVSRVVLIVVDLLLAALSSIGRQRRAPGHAAPPAPRIDGRRLFAARRTSEGLDAEGHTPTSPG